MPKQSPRLVRSLPVPTYTPEQLVSLLALVVRPTGRSKDNPQEGRRVDLPNFVLLDALVEHLRDGSIMPDKVMLFADGLYAGSVTVFDSEPSFGLLMTAFPEAKSITGCGCCGRFIVELGDASATPWAD